MFGVFLAFVALLKYYHYTIFVLVWFFVVVVVVFYKKRLSSPEDTRLGEHTLILDIPPHPTPTPPQLCFGVYKKERKTDRQKGEKGR